MIGLCGGHTIGERVANFNICEGNARKHKVRNLLLFVSCDMFKFKLIWILRTLTLSALALNFSPGNEVNGSAPAAEMFANVRHMTNLLTTTSSTHSTSSTHPASLTQHRSSTAPATKTVRFYSCATLPFTNARATNPYHLINSCCITNPHMCHVNHPQRRPLKCITTVCSLLFISFQLFSNHSYFVLTHHQRAPCHQPGPSPPCTTDAIDVPRHWSSSASVAEMNHKGTFFFSSLFNCFLITITSCHTTLHCACWVISPTTSSIHAQVLCSILMA